MEFLRRLKGIDCLRLRHVRADLAIYPFLAENFHRADEADEAPFLDLTAYPTEAEYDKRYSREQRKRRSKIRKSLAAMGTVDFRMLPPGSLMDRAMEAGHRPETSLACRAWPLQQASAVFLS